MLGHTESLEVILANSPDFDRGNWSGALYSAAVNGHPHIVSILADMPGMDPEDALMAVGRSENKVCVGILEERTRRLERMPNRVDDVETERIRNCFSLDISARCVGS